MAKLLPIPFFKKNEFSPEKHEHACHFQIMDVYIGKINQKRIYFDLKQRKV